MNIELISLSVSGKNDLEVSNNHFLGMQDMSSFYMLGSDNALDSAEIANIVVRETINGTPRFNGRNCNHYLISAHEMARDVVGQDIADDILSVRFMTPYLARGKYNSTV